MQTTEMMRVMLLIGLFAIVAGVALAAMLLLSPRNIRRRIEQIGGGSAALGGAGGPPDQPAWIQKVAEISQPISKLSLPKEGWEDSPLRIRLMNAGWRTSNAASIYFAGKTLLAIALPATVMPFLIGSRLGQHPPYLMGLLAVMGGIGYYLPNAIVSRRVAARQRTILEDFPDALDLLTVCVEAGLSLDAALLKVTEELRLRSPVIADELELMLLEMRSGFAKETSLRNLSLRTGVEDVESFSAMLIQADRFGTSLGDSLRVMSDMLRTQRRMRAEERAAKIALKLLFPLIFCIFPALLMVLLGPAFIHIYRVLLPTFAHTGGG